jgi:1-acyl-sn-glycerol-3-phosphate acyltransferase
LYRNLEILLVQLSQVPDSWEPFGNSFSRWYGRSMLKLAGWHSEGELPNENKLMFAVAPHTSNWDFLVGLHVMFAMGFKVHWLGKHSMFIWPLKGLFKKWGGVPVHRHSPKGFVEEVAEQFRSHEKLHIAIAPEGTRSKVGKLKTGFLRMAIAADVPVLLASIDYKKKAVVFGDLYHPTGDLEKDERDCYEYFKQFTARNPQNY